MQVMVPLIELFFYRYNLQLRSFRMGISDDGRKKIPFAVNQFNLVVCGKAQHADTMFAFFLIQMVG